MVVALVCGGGNGAHVMAGNAASQPGVEARVLTLFADEAERWTAAMAADGLTIVDTTGASEKQTKTRPSLVSKKPEEVVPGVDVILFAVPAFAHEQYFAALKPHVQPGTIVVGLPGQPGFEFAIRSAWGDLSKQCTVMNFVTLPWNCRIQEFGKSVQVMGVKDIIPGAISISTPPPASEPVAKVQSIIGARPILKTKGHLMSMSLSASNPILHPTIMYGTWSKWDGKPMDHKPLFYNDITEETAQHLSDCSDELVATAKAIMNKKPEVDLTAVQNALDYYVDVYGDEIKDKTSVYTALRTCAGFTGLTHPMIDTDDGKFMPNFKFRYLWEDIPCGLVVIRGIATIAGVPTPKMDQVLMWAQKTMDKEYLVDGQLTGKDVCTTRSPQRYGFNTMDKMLGLD